MTDKEKLEKSIEDLKSLTGIQFRIAEKDPEKLSEAARQVSQLVNAYREKYNKAGFVRSLLDDALPVGEIYGKASAFHIPQDGRRAVFVIETGDMDEESGEILKNLLATGPHDLMIPKDRQNVIFIRTMREREKREDLDALARTIVDMMSTEALKKVRVGYADPCDDLKDLSRTYREAAAALEVGRIFYKGDSVFAYGSLGIGRLIHSLPAEPCRLFLKEIFGENGPRTFDQETITTINAFFDNNLNISETARQLYVHRNTLVYRLEKLNAETGLDIRTFDDALTFKIAAMVIDYLNSKENVK
ncbi:MAG: helix-turn-helix domain-containing protein [Lachnospiraceae bacterium]|jgi:carbohydrate diacid regulator|nr:helix-turn-helix domain-containing protein [Lachnospiraceae bacterium]MCI1727059.1 helix-turn-helix domain-containing protein [Lachnospiraceae bacterium]